MGFNFPSSPLVGDTYPVPPVAGVPVYVWDGEKWTMSQSPAVTDVVRYDTAQSLSATQQTQARINIYAAPYNAMAYSGMQINGGMEVNQEGATPTGSYSIDGWLFAKSGTMAIAHGQNSGGVFPPLGFANNLAFGVGTAQASLGATDFTAFIQYIEGYRIARLAWGTVNAQAITIGFWTSHNRTGVYSGVVRNSVGGTPNRCYGFTYTHNVSNTPQYNTVTIPGDTIGTWAIDNTRGLAVIFAAGSGTTYTTPSVNTWLAGNYLAAAGQINGVAATSDVFRITGVTVLPGTQAPTAAQSPNIMRPYGEELRTCQRYYQKMSMCTVATATAANQFFSASYPFTCEMRGAPTITTTGGGAVVNCSSASFDTSNIRACRAWFQSAAAGTVSVDNHTGVADARL